jgi:hypothetical protein
LNFSKFNSDWTIKLGRQKLKQKLGSSTRVLTNLKSSLPLAKAFKSWMTLIPKQYLNLDLVDEWIFPFIFLTCCMEGFLKN